MLKFKTFASPVLARRGRVTGRPTVAVGVIGIKLELIVESLKFAVPVYPVGRLTRAGKEKTFIYHFQIIYGRL